MTLFFFSTKNKYINKEMKKKKKGKENENVHIGPVKDNHYK